MTRTLCHFMSALAIAATFSLIPARSRACIDAGPDGPPPAPLVPAFDAGPGCTVWADSCGSYHSTCDAGSPDAPRDAGPSGTGTGTGTGSTRDAGPRSTRDSDIGGGGAGLPLPARSGGCSVSTGASSSTVAWILGLAALVLGRRRARAS